MLMLAGIDDPKLDSTAFHPSSSFHSLPRLSSVILGTLHRRLWVVWFYGFSAHDLFTSRLLPLSVGRQSVSVSATVTTKSESSVSAVVSVTAITGLQIRRHFQLRPKPEKVVSVGV